MDSLEIQPGKVYEFTYCNHEQKIEKRVVIVEGISHGTFPFHEHRCWVLNAWCLDRKARRTFELGRIADDIVQVR